MVIKILPDLFCIKVALPNSPLKTLNSYVFKGRQRSLLVDTGFNRPECLASLQEGIAELNLNMHATDILLTHCHADHSGLVHKIATPETQIYMHPIDHKLITDFVEHVDFHWNQVEDNYVREGFPREEMRRVHTNNPARSYAPERPFACIPITDNTRLKAGERELQCIFTPGHTPGNMCFYGEQDKLMLTGDHVLFDISPNITVWADLPDALAHYLSSLRKVRDYEVELPLAGHRESEGHFRARIDYLLQHHEQRLQNAYHIVAKGEIMSAYQVAAAMKWDIRAKDWSDFPLSQKFFAVGEAIAHLNYLTDQGRLQRKLLDNTNYYVLS